MTGFSKKEYLVKLVHQLELNAAYHSENEHLKDRLTRRNDLIKKAEQELECSIEINQQLKKKILDLESEIKNNYR